MRILATTCVAEKKFMQNLKVQKTLLLLLGFIALCVTNIAKAHEALPLFTTQYTAKLYGFSIDATMRLTALTDEHYEFYFNATSSIGSITEASNLKWDALEQTVIPYNYTYRRTGLGKNKQEEFHFDWANRNIINVVKNTTWPMNNVKKIQDSLSYQVQLRQDLLAGKKEFSYPISNGRKIKEYRFEIVGEEILQTPLGDVTTVKVKRSYTNDDRVTYAWLAKNFQYLLVRLQQEENGSAYTIYLSKAAVNGKAIEHF